LFEQLDSKKRGEVNKEEFIQYFHSLHYYPQATEIEALLQYFKRASGIQY